MVLSTALKNKGLRYLKNLYVLKTLKIHIFISFFDFFQPNYP